MTVVNGVTARAFVFSVFNRLDIPLDTLEPEEGRGLPLFEIIW